MITFIFIGIWGFVIFNKCYRQLKYRNYILEKIENRLALNNELQIKNNKETINEENTEVNNIPSTKEE
ncbi:hypothetical protein [Clostridium massiliamazoniense]|uniref:hypothetical protein n=1 Tax=Clostridium massiliamazoniense TaxID=1347366 RepID=UPI001A9A59E9|nr:hypothetical protein [Clostridium massiliamazoniense]